MSASDHENADDEDYPPSLVCDDEYHNVAHYPLRCTKSAVSGEKDGDYEDYPPPCTIFDCKAAYFQGVITGRLKSVDEKEDDEMPSLECVDPEMEEEN